MRAVQKEAATVYRIGRRRFLTRRAAYKAAARAILTDAFNNGEPCYCSRGDYETGGAAEPCDYHAIAYAPDSRSWDLTGAENTLAAWLSWGDSHESG